MEKSFCELYYTFGAVCATRGEDDLLIVSAVLTLYFTQITHTCRHAFNLPATI